MSKKAVVPSKTKIAVIGGHLTPAVAFMQSLQTKQPDSSIVFIGREYSQRGKTQKSHERKTVKEIGATFIPLEAPRLHSYQPLAVVKTITGTIGSMMQAWKILGKQQPDVIVSFGSYLAVPVALAGFLRNIPIITHEQTLAPGISNRIISFFARMVAINDASVIGFFPKKKTKVIPTPVRSGIVHPTNTRPEWLAKRIVKPILLIQGGNQGSYIINNVISQTLPQLTAEYTVIHACGNPTSSNSYKRQLEKKAQALPLEQQKRYYVHEWVSEAELGWILSQEKVVSVARSGANTIMELIATQTPAILIPLPFAHYNEQLKNAQIMSDAGGGSIIQQHNFNSTTLLQELATIAKTYRAHQRKLALLDLPTNGGDQLVETVIQVLSK